MSGTKRSKDQIAYDITTQTKQCTVCGQRKSFGDFRVRTKEVDGRDGTCILCRRDARHALIVANGGVPVVHRTKAQIAHDMTTQSKQCNACGKRKSFAEFWVDVHSPDGVCQKCAECLLERKYKRINKDPEKHKHMSRNARLKNKYGVDIEWYTAKLKEQSGKCAICGVSENLKVGIGSIESFHVDHDHETGVIRGLLCGSCNRAIGLLGDSSATANNAAIYLAKHEKIPL